MTLKFCSLASGSSGNCYLAATEETLLLIDAGISARRICRGLEDRGLCPDRLSAVLLTHEHSDHCKGLGPLLRKECGMRAFANRNTWEALPDDSKEEAQFCVFENGDSFEVGDIRIKSFDLSHDACHPSGFSLESQGRCISLVTDTGYLSGEQLRQMRRADLLVLEANHDPDMLRMGPYPYSLKRRILGEEGHLSNEAAAMGLVEILRQDPKKRRVLLAHLSKENNFPEMAYQTVKNILEDHGFAIGRDLALDILRREEASPLYVV